MAKNLPVTFAATQMACSDDKDANVAIAEEQVRSAAAKGAQIILLQELFETPYFCKDLDSRYFELAHDANSSSLLKRFSALARELKVVPRDDGDDSVGIGEILRHAQQPVGVVLGSEKGG